jgi:EAL domain-containing protein (putative c-di-GMP-specific phosphodiesterase class I)
MVTLGCDHLIHRIAGAIARTVTGLGNSLGMATTREGVETHEKVLRLQAEDCSEVQGCFFSKPAPAHHLPGL